MTGEHTVSKAFLRRISQEFTESPDVQIRNLAFQPKDKTKSFAVGSLESRILWKTITTACAIWTQRPSTAFDAFEAMHYAAIREAPRNAFTTWMAISSSGGCSRPSAGGSTAAPCGPRGSRSRT